MQDIAQALSNSLDRNGYGGMRAPLNLGGFPIQNVLPGTADTDVATVGQLVSVPPGTIVDFAGSSAPSGWLLCFGQAVSRTGYASLFAAIGTTYGSGDGSTTFNLPDCRGRVSAGKDDMGGTSAGRLISQMASQTLGGAGGSSIHTLSASEMPSHTHTASTSPDGSHSHGIPGRDGSDTSGPYVGGANTNFNSKATDPNGVHTHAVTVESAGGGAAHNNVQPTIIFNKIIRAGG